MKRILYFGQISMFYVLSLGCGERIHFQELPLGINHDTALVSHNAVRENVVATIKPVTLLFFGYTRCPDFCPMTLHKLQAAVGEDAKLKENLRLIFISVDPKNDKPAELKNYLSAFPYARGYLPREDELRTVEKAFGAFSKQERETISHSLYLYLLNSKGRVIHLIRSDAPVADLRKTMLQALETQAGK
jgi:protein SCO1/2